MGAICLGHKGFGGTENLLHMKQGARYHHSLGDVAVSIWGEVPAV